MSENEQPMPVHKRIQSLYPAVYMLSALAMIVNSCVNQQSFNYNAAFALGAFGAFFGGYVPGAATVGFTTALSKAMSWAAAGLRGDREEQKRLDNDESISRNAHFAGCTTSVLSVVGVAAASVAAPYLQALRP